MKQEQTIKQDIKKLQKSRVFLTILILLFVVLLFWVVISLITSQTSEKIDPELQLLSKPLTPVIDMSVFDQISQKREYSEEELSAFTIFKILVSGDGRTERIVPIEVTIDDLEPGGARAIQPGSSLLQDEITNSEEESSGLDFSNEPVEDTSNLGQQL